MITEKIDLYKYFGVKRPKGASGYLTTYVQTVANNFDKARRRPSIVICPGGGYSWLSDREKEPVAIAFLAKGFNAFVLEYSVKPLYYPTPLLEAGMAVAYVKENAEKLNVDKKHVAIGGFSAGGHLACSLGTLYKDEVFSKKLGDRAKLCKPDATVLSYPVITADRTYRHSESIEYVSNYDAKIMEKMSLENQVKKTSAPAFIWHTKEDNLVPVMNSLMLATAYAKAGADFELHVFEKGQHGLSLSTRETAEGKDDVANINADAEKWLNLAVEFLKRRGFKY